MDSEEMWADASATAGSDSSSDDDDESLSMGDFGGIDDERGVSASKDDEASFASHEKTGDKHDNSDTIATTSFSSSTFNWSSIVVDEVEAGQREGNQFPLAKDAPEWGGWRSNNRLIKASSVGRLSDVKTALSKGIHIDSPGTDGTALYYACRNGHLEIVQYLIDHGAAVDSLRPSEYAPLYVACLQNHMDVAEYMIQSHQVARAQAKYLLHQALERGHTQIVRGLIAKSYINVKARDSEGCTPLHFASVYYHDKEVDLLIQHGAAPDAAAVDGNTPLHEAVRRGNFLVSKQLIVKHNAKVNIQNSAGNTPLHLACRRGWVEHAKFLIQHGASLEIAGNGGCSPLHVAAVYGHLSVVKLLVKNRASLRARDENGRTPLERARKHHTRRDNVIKYLEKELAEAERNILTAARIGDVQAAKNVLSRYPDLADCGKFDETPLRVACKEGHLPFVQYLVRDFEGAFVHRFGAFSHNKPLKDAVTRGHLLIVQCLMDEYTVDPNNPELIIAAGSGGHLPVVEYFLEKAGSDPDTVAALLHVACQKGHLRVVKHLVDHCNADVNSYDGDGETSLSLAFSNNHVEIVQFLLNNQRLPDQVKKVLEIVVSQNRIGYSNYQLFDSASRGNLAGLQEAVRKGANVNGKDQDGRTPLHIASMRHHLDIVTWLVEDAIVDANAKDNNGWTALHSVSGHVQCLDIVQYFVESALVDTDLQDNQGKTALDLAKHAKQLRSISGWQAQGDDAVEYLQNHAYRKYSALLSLDEQLWTWAQEGWLEGVEEACLKGAYVDGKNSDGDTALHLAAEAGHLDIMKFLVDQAGADIEIISRSGETVFERARLGPSSSAIIAYFATQAHEAAEREQALNFLLAAENGNLEQVGFFLQEGVDANTISDSNSQKSSLQFACEIGHLDMVLLLLDHGANTMYHDQNQRSALHYASENGHPDVAHILLSKAGDTDISGGLLESQDSNSLTPLQLALKGGHTQVASLLIQSGAIVFPLNQENESVLHIASHHGQFDTVKMLLSMSPNESQLLELQDSNGRTALHRAILMGHNHVAEFLVTRFTTAISWRRSTAPRYGENVNIQDGKGQTALHIACYLGFCDIVKKLVEVAQADVEVKDKDGQKPMKIAIAGGNKDIVAFICDAPRIQPPVLDVDFDVFISHAGEQKHSFALPIHRGLLDGAGADPTNSIRPFVDKENLPAGQKGDDIMIEAMNTAPVGVFILSPEFLAKEWPMKELFCFLESVTWEDCGLPPDDLFAKYRSAFDNPKFKFWERVEAGQTSLEDVAGALKKLKVFSGEENVRGDEQLISKTVNETFKQWRDLKSKL